LIRAFYNWLVIDLGRLSNYSRSLLGRVDDVLLVYNDQPPALFETRRSIEALRNMGFVGTASAYCQSAGNPEDFVLVTDFCPAIVAVLPAEQLSSFTQA